MYKGAPGQAQLGFQFRHGLAGARYCGAQIADFLIVAVLRDGNDEVNALGALAHNKSAQSAVVDILSLIHL